DYSTLEVSVCVCVCVCVCVSVCVGVCVRVCVCVCFVNKVLISIAWHISVCNISKPLFILRYTNKSKDTFFDNATRSRIVSHRLHLSPVCSRCGVCVCVCVCVQVSI